jgi:hypothetical protein
MWGCELISSGSELDLTADFREQSNKLTGSRKVSKFIEPINYYQFLKKGSTSWYYLLVAVW